MKLPNVGDVITVGNNSALVTVTVSEEYRVEGIEPDGRLVSFCPKRCKWRATSSCT